MKWKLSSSGLGGIFSILLSFLPLMPEDINFYDKASPSGANNTMGFGKAKQRDSLVPKQLSLLKMAGVTER